MKIMIVGEEVDNIEFSCSSNGNVISYSHYGKQCGVSSKNWNDAVKMALIQSDWCPYMKKFGHTERY